MFWLGMNITSSKDVNIGKSDLPSALLQRRLSESSFEASGLRISSGGGNTWIHAPGLSIKHSQSEGSLRPGFSYLENRTVGVDGPFQHWGLPTIVLRPTVRFWNYKGQELAHWPYAINVSPMDDSSLDFHFFPKRFWKFQSWWEKQNQSRKPFSLAFALMSQEHFLLLLLHL